MPKPYWYTIIFCLNNSVSCSYLRLGCVCKRNLFDLWSCFISKMFFLSTNQQQRDIEAYRVTEVKDVWSNSDASVWCNMKHDWHWHCIHKIKLHKNSTKWMSKCLTKETCNTERVLGQNVTVSSSTNIGVNIWQHVMPAAEVCSKPTTNDVEGSHESVSAPESWWWRHTFVANVDHTATNTGTCNEKSTRLIC